MVTLEETKNWLHSYIIEGEQIQIVQKGPKTFLFSLHNIELTDRLLAILLGIKAKDYKEMAREKFQGRSSYQGYKSAFGTEELAKKFLEEYINPIIVMKLFNNEIIIKKPF